MLAKSIVLLFAAATALAAPVSEQDNLPRGVQMRASETVNPAAVKKVTCVNPKTNIVFHDANVALLAICGSIAGTIQKCNGNPVSTVGQSGTAKFTLKAASPGATINISKGRWEQCVRAARAKCPTGTLNATCAGGASTGDVDFSLDGTGK